MIKETAKKLLPCVNDPKHLEALSQYVKDRIDSQTKNLEITLQASAELSP